MTNVSTASGREPIDTQTWIRAAGEGDAARVESLLAAGADVNATLESGETALIRATSKGHLHVVKILLDAGADPNAEREDGFTALGVAVFFGYADIVRVLLAGGADPAAQGRLGTTAEKWALFNGFNEIAEMLRSSNSRAGRGSAAGAASGTETTDAPLFFPAEGTFSAVIPLSNIGGTTEDSGIVLTGGAPSGERGIVRGAVAEHELNEEEVVTVVRPRVHHAVPPPRPAFAARSNKAGRSWPAMVVVLTLSVVAGLAAGSYLMRWKRPSATPQPASVADNAAPPAGVETQATEPQPAAAVPDVHASQPAPPVKSSDDQPAAKTARESRRDATSTTRASRTDSLKVEEKTAGVRRVADATPRARRAQPRVSTSTPHEHTLPVFSPPPSAGSEKKKVIPWP